MQTEGQRLRDEGIDKAASNPERSWALGMARACAYLHARKSKGRTCTADDVYKMMKPETVEALGPASGAIFRTGYWEDTGKMVFSDRPSCHANRLIVWRLKPGV